VPPHDDLRRRAAQPLGDAGDDGVLQRAALEAAVPLEDDAALAVPVEEGAVEQQRAPLALVHRRDDAGGLLQLVELCQREVADADVAHQPVLPRGDQVLPDLDARAVVRRPVHEPQVERVEAQLLQALLEGLPARSARSGGSLLVTKTSSRATPLCRSAAPTWASLP
jgi:hypothetical protein